MRILFISLRPLSGHQPWARRSLNIIQALADAGNSVTVLAPQKAIDVFHDSVELNSLSYSRVRAFQFLTFFEAFLKSWRSLLSKKVDAVHFAGGAVCLYALLGTMCRAPVVYDVWRSAGERCGCGGWVQAVRERLDKMVMNRVDTITCSCPMLEDELVTQGTSTKVCLVENAVGATHSVVSDLGAHPVVVYEHPDRDIDSLANVLRICAKLKEREPEIRFILCTELNPSSRKIVELMERLELQGHCVLQEFCDESEQASLLAGASALLLPEARSGYVDERIIRFMRSGTPIVATRIKAYKQFLDGSRAFLAAVGVDDLVEGLAQILREPLISSAMAREAQAYAVAHFTRSSFNRKVRAVYNELRG